MVKMPNWCTTYITINYDDEEKIKKLYENLEKWTERNYIENDFGPTWLGNIVLGSGIGTVNRDKETDISCRGNLCYMDYYKNSINIQTETAWVPMMNLWKKLVDKYLPDAEILFTANEPGFNIHITNEPELMNKWVCVTDTISEYEIDKNELIDIMKEKTKSKLDNFDELLQEFRKRDDVYDVYQIQGVNLLNWL